MNNIPLEPILVLAGPTGAGKSALAMKLAEVEALEIVSADSRQIYRGMDIGTAKPSTEDKQTVPHHFIDERDIAEPWSAGAFAKAAYERIAEIREHGARPVVVGGSTLYVEALVHGIAEVPDSDPEIRAELNAIVEAPGGAQRLFDELQHVDPKGASTLDPTKTQRIVRALEVFQTTGEPWSSFFEEATPPPYPFRVVVVTRDREELYARIEERVEEMLSGGLLEENRRLMDAGHRLDINPLRTIGYQEPIAHLREEIDFDEMVRLLKRNTRRYAKRQLTWFRRHPEYEWLNLSEYDNLEEVVKLLRAEAS